VPLVDCLTTSEPSYLLSIFITIKELLLIPTTQYFLCLQTKKSLIPILEVISKTGPDDLSLKLVFGEGDEDGCSSEIDWVHQLEEHKIRFKV
jgi:hypothetical protein